MLESGAVYKEFNSPLNPANWAVYLFMDTKDVIKKDGVVKEALMGGMFKIEFDDSTVAFGTLSGKMRKFHIRILPGDKVKVEFSPHDLNRGRITFRYR